MFVHPVRALLRRLQEVLKGGKVVLRRLEINAGNVGCVPKLGRAHSELEVGSG